MKYTTKVESAEIIFYISATIKILKELNNMIKILKTPIPELEESAGFPEGSIDLGILSKGELYSSLMADSISNVNDISPALSTLALTFGTDYTVPKVSEGYSILSVTQKKQLSLLARGIDIDDTIYGLLCNNLIMVRDYISYGFYDALDPYEILSNPADIQNEIIAGFESAGLTREDLIKYVSELNNVHVDNKTVVYEINDETYELLSQQASYTGLPVNILMSMGEYILPYDVELIKSNQLSVDMDYLQRLASRRTQAEDMAFLRAPGTFLLAYQKTDPATYPTLYEKEYSFDIQQLTIASQMEKGFTSYYETIEQAKQQQSDETHCFGQ